MLDKINEYIDIFEQLENDVETKNEFKIVGEALDALNKLRQIVETRMETCCRSNVLLSSDGVKWKFIQPGHYKDLAGKQLWVTTPAAKPQSGDKTCNTCPHKVTNDFADPMCGRVNGEKMPEVCPL
ncbi:MAG: hypothetical protein [Podoviridae sp. cty5g4]|nr:MAG: hypothetical protein [Podoviridae sp. cty5g4]